jgi:tetratricopeptide (TPR) repeat protein
VPTCLSAYLYRLGRLDQARDAALEAVARYRDLVAVNPAAFRFALTRALGNLGNVLSDRGDRAEGVALNGEAVRIRRERAAANPLAFTADLARAESRCRGLCPRPAARNSRWLRRGTR